MMKVLIVCTRLCYGGAERVAVMLANGLVQKGYDVAIASNLYDEITYKIEEQVSLFNDKPAKGGKIKKHIGSIKRLRGYVKQFKPDVVIGINWFCSLKAKMACCGLNIPVVSTVHDAFERPVSAPMSVSEYFIKYYLNRIYPAVTVLTHRDAQLLQKKIRNVYVMPNPLGVAIANCVPEKQKIILAAGRLESWHCKGLDLLIEAWGKIASSYPQWKLQIAGAGTSKEKQFLIDMSREAGVENSVEFLGFRQDIVELYKQSAIFVLSSRYEGFGLVLTEAMSQGCACVAADYKGRQRDIITNNNEGVICNPDSAESIAQALQQLLQDDSYRQHVQRQAIVAAQRFSLHKIIELWDNMLAEITK